MKILKNQTRIRVLVLNVPLILLAMAIALNSGSLPSPVRAFAANTYTVQPGDSLYSIGLKFNVSWQSIAAANNIVSPYTIYSGEVLEISSTGSPGVSSVTILSTDASNKSLSGFNVNLTSTSTGSTIVSSSPTTMQTTIGQSYLISVQGSGLYHFLYWSDTGSTNKHRTFTATSSPSTFVAVFSKLKYYTVQPGDSLYSIGLKFNVSWQSIAAANNIVSPYTIYPGEVLKIPVSTNNSIATGNTNYDQYDGYILTSSQKYFFPDPMIIKSMVMQESAFVSTAVSSDIPCGIPAGWTSYQSKSFGLMQVTPACVQPNTIPNLTQDQLSTQWPTSWFNPKFNIDQGTSALSTTLSDMKARFSGCSTTQYTLMAVGAYNSGEGAIYGCGSWNDRASAYISAILGIYQTFAQMAKMPNPY